MGPWIQGSDLAADKLIQPLKISGTTPGESDSNEGEHLDRASTPGPLTLTHPDGIDETADDPDLLVVGFQELDLSAGALLYSTETLREDAWTSAVFAGLGEKIELYDKVSRDGCSSLKVNELLSTLSCSGSWPRSNWLECSS